jgi:hypothetical protein
MEMGRVMSGLQQRRAGATILFTENTSEKLLYQHFVQRQRHFPSSCPQRNDNVCGRLLSRVLLKVFLQIQLLLVILALEPLFLMLQFPHYKKMQSPFSGLTGKYLK